MSFSTKKKEEKVFCKVKLVVYVCMKLNVFLHKYSPNNLISRSTLRYSYFIVIHKKDTGDS